MATISWNNVLGGDWSTVWNDPITGNVVTNWNLPRIPQNSDFVQITLGGTYTVNASSIINTLTGLNLGGSTGTQTLNLQGGTLTLNGNSTVGSRGVLNLASAGTVNGTGALTVAGRLIWGDTSGNATFTLSGSGKKTVTGILNLNGYQTLDGTTLETSGATVWTGDGYLLMNNNAVWNNTSTGTIDLQGDADIISPDYFNGTKTFNNAGTLTKSGGVTDNSNGSDIESVFNNTGTVNVNRGLLVLRRGGTNSNKFNIASGASLWIVGYDYTFNAGNSVSGTGNLLIQNESAAVPTININAPSTWSTSVTMIGGNITGAGSLTLSNTFNWNGGTLSGTGKKTITGTLNLTQSIQNAYLSGTTLETTGKTVWDDFFLAINDGAVWNNTSTGSIDLKGDGDLLWAFGNNNIKPIFNNAGTFIKSGGKTLDPNFDYSEFDVIFNNTGTVEVKQGLLRLTGEYTQTNGITRLSGGNISLYDWVNTLQGSMNIQGGVLTGIGTIKGDVTNSGGQVNPGNTVGTLRIEGNYRQSGAGLLNFDLNSATTFDRFNVTEEGDFGGILKLSLRTGYTPTIGTKFTVLTYGSATAKSFSSVQGIDISSTLAFAPTSTGNNLILEVVDQVRNLGTIGFTTPQSVTDFVGDSDVFDFYRFTVADTSNTQIRLTNLTANADVWLVDSLGRNIAQGATIGNANEIFNRIVDAGTYFVKVFRPQTGNNTNYALQVNTSTVISVAATDNNAAETDIGVTSNPGVFTLTRTGDTSQALTVNYTWTGTATNGTDYTSLPTSATFAAGSSTAIITVNPTNDNIFEGTETATLSLIAGTGYAVGTAASSTIEIADNDPQPTIRLSANQTIVEGATNPQSVTYTVTLSNPSSQTVSVNYTTVDGTAKAGLDYTNTFGTLFFDPGVTSQVIAIPILNDSLNEANESFTLRLSSPGNVSLSTVTQVTTTITDTLSASVTTTLPANVENLTLTGTANINGTGNAGNNVIRGNGGNNTLTGGVGKDTLFGGVGIDRFSYTTLTHSLLSNFDVITDFNATTGKDLFLVTNARAGFNNVGTVATLDAAGISAKLTTANFGVNFADQFSFGTRTFVAINDATAGFNAAADAIIEVTGLTGTLGINNFVTV